MPQEDESVALSSIATLPDGTTMSLADYLLGKPRPVSPEEKALDDLSLKQMHEDTTRTGPTPE